MANKYPPGDRESHDAFCRTEGWTLVRGATGKPVTHHTTYEITLWDGRVLRTRISRPINSSEYGSRMWSHILKEQLTVSQEEFWDCVRHGKVPDRGFAPMPAPEHSIPLFLLKELIRLGVSEKDALALTPAEAAQKRADLLLDGENAEENLN